MGDLLPCPHCASQNVFAFRHVAAQPEPCVMCKDCHSSAVSVSAWNRRALPAAPAEDVRAGALEWRGFDRSYMNPGIPCGYGIVGDDEEGWQVSLSWRTCEETLYGTHPTMDAARAAAETDLRGRLALIPEAKPAQDARSANRVEYNDDGTLDEIVTDAGVHLEDLGGNRWFLGAARSDGTEIRVWFRGKVTMIEDDAAEAKP